MTPIEKGYTKLNARVAIPESILIYLKDERGLSIHGSRFEHSFLLQGVRAELLAQRMGYDRKLTPGMIQALQDRLQEEIDKRTKKVNS